VFHRSIPQGGAVTPLALSIALSLLSACAHVAPTVSSLGESAEGHPYTRTIKVGPTTRFVNVDSGEVIKFVVQGPDGAERAFTWTFARVRETVGDLGQLAPAGAVARPVKIIVGPNPLYQ